MCQEDQRCHEASGEDVGPQPHPFPRSQPQGYSIVECPALAYEVFQSVLIAAVGGQKLPQLTVTVALFVVAHIGITSDSTGRLAWPLMLSTAFIVLSGYVFLVALYRHAILNVFNSKIPGRFLPSFFVHLSILRPLEIIARYITYRLRVLPDIIVLGEVRCGTTTMCQHLASVRGCHEPFCLWRHPELDKKETFFFVGHYLGNVHPRAYSMCFPLAFTKFFCRRILQRPFFTFDGCAQYLTSPTAPYLIAKAYKDAGQSPPVLIACVRDPVDQAISWWKYENNAMAWGRNMGLSKWNTTTRTPCYAPKTISRALAFSSSSEVDRMYEKAEELFRNSDEVESFSLPDWAMTWPGGQLSGIGRNGLFFSNIQRYERVFSEEFGDPSNKPTVPKASTLKFVNVIPLEFMKSDEQVLSILTSIFEQVNRRIDSRQKIELKAARARVGVHRNASAALSNPGTEPKTSEKTALRTHFLRDTKLLEETCGMEFGWKTSGPCQ